MGRQFSNVPHNRNSINSERGTLYSKLREKIGLNQNRMSIILIISCFVVAIIILVQTTELITSLVRKFRRSDLEVQNRKVTPDSGQLTQRTFDVNERVLNTNERVDESPVASPSIVQMPSGTPIPTNLISDEGHYRRVWIAYNHYIPLSAPRVNAPIAAGVNPLQFLETFGYTTTGPDNNMSTYLLLAQPDEVGTRARGIIGWARSEYLLKDPHAQVDPTTRIALKALILPSAADIPAQQSGSRRIEARLAPTANATGIPLRPMERYFIYTFADEHYLIGSNIAFTPYSDNSEMRKVILGWVHTKYVCRWDTREAAFWDTSKTSVAPGIESGKLSGRIYKTREDAYASLNDQSIQPLLAQPVAIGQKVATNLVTSVLFPIIKVHERHSEFGELIQFSVPVLDSSPSDNTKRIDGSSSPSSVLGGGIVSKQSSLNLKEGWAWSKRQDKTNQFRFYVLINDMEMAAITNALDRVINSRGFTQNNSLNDLLATSIEIRIGEFGFQNPKDDQHSQRLARLALASKGLSIKAPIISTNTNNVASLDKEQIGRLTHIRDKLGDVKYGVRREYRELQENQDGRTFKIKVPTKEFAFVTREFFFEGNPTKFYWVDLADEWP